MSHAMLCQSQKTRALLRMLLMFWLAISVTSAFDCDQTIRSKDGAEKNGTFTTPNYPKNYQPDLRCTFKLIAKENERVEVRFLKFEVRGVPPRCTHDYVDVYTQVRRPDDDLLDLPLHGRYCGSDTDELPHLLISMGNIFIVGFYSDGSRSMKGFKAEYRFIDASVYTIGTPAPPNVCGQTIRGETVMTGTILSPTYPGMYPDNIFCYYKIQGVVGQRIKLTFKDLDLYSGGEHCPFDFVKIYDGYTNQADVIGTYCGKLKDFSIWSTTEALHIEFSTKSGRVEPTKKPYVTYWEIEEDMKVQRRGFKADFTISDQYVGLDFISGGHIHVRGTECDQRILSKGETNGTITSPGFPNLYPINITCRYYIDGLVDKQNLEKARLWFESFDIPKIKDGCDNGNLSAYIKGQELASTERDKDLTADHQFCGQELPPMLTTSAPRLLLVLDTHGQYSGRGFKAHYQFVTNYAIPGTPATNGAKCHFIYRSSSGKYGSFNSPRNPSNYPSNAICMYEFIGNEREQVRISFENFKTVDPGNPRNCSRDYVEIFTVKPYKDRPGATHDVLLGKYCGEIGPGPLVSDEDSSMIKVYFHSDGEEVNSGFRARYEFINRLPYGQRCQHNLTAETGGIIKIPQQSHKYGKNLTCEWYLYSKRPDATILLTFETFSMEGTPKIVGLLQSPRKYSAQGCGNAVLRIFTSGSSRIPTHELCGTTKPEKDIISQGPSLRMEFISSSHAIGAKGFRIAWTELLPQDANYCYGHKCEESGYCISSALKCNNIPNCGVEDRSDESKDKCGPAYSDHSVLHIVLGVVIVLIVLVFIIVCILHRRRKVRKRKNKKEIEVRYVTRGSTPNRTGPAHAGGAGDKLLKERTEKVSIV